MAEPKKTPGSIVKDSELTAMSRISKTLDDLEPNTRKRVFQWISEREKNREGASPETSSPTK